jgi:hypothetical protein
MKSFIAYVLAIVLLSMALAYVADEVVQGWLWHPSTRIGLLKIG